jgi:hypothetical protein
MDPKAATVSNRQSLPPGVLERRDPQSRERLRGRVRSEFDGTPGLVLTPAEAARLFGIREDICIRVMGELQAEGRLYSSGERYSTQRSFD